MSTQTIIKTLALGQEVTVDAAAFGRRFPGVFIITKVPHGARGVNYVAKPKDNLVGMGVRGPAEVFLAHETGTPAPDLFAPVPYVHVPCAGTVVAASGLRGVADGTLFVILGQARVAGAAKIVRLGGENGRYYPSVAMSKLTVVDSGAITVAA